ncbi:hypothetical protein D3C72_498580 [compost metagenome]
MGAGEFPGELGVAIDLVWVDLAAQIGHKFRTVFQHPGVFVVGKLRTQLYENFRQMHGIFGGVADLGFRKWTLQPVGAGFALRQFDAEHFLHQPRIAHGKTQVQVSGSQLRIEQRHRQAAGQAQQDFEVFTAGMDDFDHSRVFQQRGQGLPVVDGQRINQVSAYAIAHLQQAGDRIEGVDPHEFGVEGNVGQLLPLGAKPAEAIVVANPVNIDGHTALP